MVCQYNATKILLHFKKILQELLIDCTKFIDFGGRSFYDVKSFYPRTWLIFFHLITTHAQRFCNLMRKIKLVCKQPRCERNAKCKLGSMKLGRAFYRGETFVGSQPNRGEGTVRRDEGSTGHRDTGKR
jgi:hypothetical protein